MYARGLQTNSKGYSDCYGWHEHAIAPEMGKLGSQKILFFSLVTLGD